MRIRSCAISDVGLKRGHNEDNYLINEELNLYVVADGMGGHAGGEYASAIAVNTVEEIVTSMEISGDSAAESDDPVERNREKLRYALRLAGRRIYEKADEEPEYRGMGTTAVVLMLDAGNAYFAHVGDSRIYLYRGGKIEQVTEDHSLVAEKIKRGLITPEEAKTHRMRNVITRSLGFQDDVEVDLTVRASKTGDQYLLCSDGLSGHVEAEEMADIMGRLGPQDACRRLVELACDRGGDDNITVVVLKVEEGA